MWAWASSAARSSATWAASQRLGAVGGEAECGMGDGSTVGRGWRRGRAGGGGGEIVVKTVYAWRNCLGTTIEIP
jgi:hypothetical protein